jgi:hypothetical protein
MLRSFQISQTTSKTSEANPFRCGLGPSANKDHHCSIEEGSGAYLLVQPEFETQLYLNKNTTGVPLLLVRFGSTICVSSKPNHLKILRAETKTKSECTHFLAKTNQSIFLLMGSTYRLKPKQN